MNVDGKLQVIHLHLFLLVVNREKNIDLYFSFLHLFITCAVDVMFSNPLLGYCHVNSGQQTHSAKQIWKHKKISRLQENGFTSSWNKVIRILMWKFEVIEISKGETWVTRLFTL
jgi:hypothetical protein